MSLIFRRIISSIVNGTLIFFFLCLVSTAIAIVFWFYPVKSSIDLSIFYLIFAFSYTMIGSLGISSLPRIGSILTGIKINKIGTQNNKSLSIFSRTILFYLLPVASLTMAQFLFFILAGHDKAKNIFLFVPSAFISMIVLLALPISIVIGKGRQGIHDYLTGIIICRKNEKYDHITTQKNIIKKTLIVASILSAIIIFVLLKLIFHFNYQNTILRMATSNEDKGQYFEEIKNIDSVMPNTPIDIRSYELSDGIMWWVDLTPDVEKRINYNRSIGLTQLNVLDLLGYGININKTRNSIDLINIDRNKSKEISPGANKLEVSFFVDTGAFYYEEIKNKIYKSFKNSLLEIASKYDIEIIQLRFIRLMKIGYISIGFCDERYITSDGKMWRDNNMLSLPIILTIDNRITRKGLLIIGADLS
ncbi:MAG: hypothetical protein M0P70_07305 [Desulfobulbaceae bacterium]|nr:hypothetical protein [Desulfobulbaceae bacterium]